MADLLRIVVSEDGADAERLDALTGFLREDLRAVDDIEVAAVKGSAPEGTRGFDPVEAGTLAVTLLTSEALQQVVRYVRAWLRRGSQTAASPSTRTLRLELDGDVLELAGASEAEQQQLVQLFVLRHVGQASP